MFSVNQNRQLYVVKAWSESKLVSGGTATPGTCYFGNDGKNYFFQYINAKGEAIRSDLINPCKINYVRNTVAADMIPFVKQYTVEVSTDILSSDKVPAGKHYILRLQFTKMVGISEEEQGMVFGDCYTTTAIEPAALLKKLAISLAKNVAADKTGTKLVKIEFGSTEVTAETTESDLESEDAEAITLTEMVQDWSRGKRQFRILPFSVSGNRITIDGVDAPWVDVDDTTGNIPFESVAADTVNGKLIADLEWFCAGEKGDQYRGIGWPNNIETEYMVDPSLSYDLLDVSYFYSGDNEDVQHSSKVITLAAIQSAKSGLATIATALAIVPPEEGVVESGD